MLKMQMFKKIQSQPSQRSQSNKQLDYGVVSVVLQSDSRY